MEALEAYGIGIASIPALGGLLRSLFWCRHVVTCIPLAQHEDLHGVRLHVVLHINFPQIHNIRQKSGTIECVNDQNQPQPMPADELDLTPILTDPSRSHSHWASSLPSRSRFSRIPFSFERACMALASHDFDWLAGRAASQTGKLISSFLLIAPFSIASLPFPTVSLPHSPFARQHPRGSRQPRF